jgi:hypothetical protein
MSGYSYAFISYQTVDRSVAGEVKDHLAKAGIRSFLAHEDIEVSVEWRSRILQELRAADMFVALLSKAYLQSTWCVQESGVAASRSDLLVVPLSLDGTIPPGFLGIYQSSRQDPAHISLQSFAPALTSKDPDKGLYNLVHILAASTNYRTAEANFAPIIPHIPTMGPTHAAAIIAAASANDQISNASMCVTQYIPQVLRAYPRVGSRGARKELRETCKRYNVRI